MNKLTVAMLAAAALVAGMFTAATAATINCAPSPYCARNVVVPALPSQAAANGSTAQRAEIIIDVDEPLPLSVTFESPNGGVITLVRRVREQTADVSTDIATTDSKSGPVLGIFGSYDPYPDGYEIIKQYRVIRSGDGSLSITHTVRDEPNAQPYTETIPVHVR